MMCQQYKGTWSTGIRHSVECFWTKIGDRTSLLRISAGEFKAFLDAVTLLMTLSLKANAFSNTQIRNVGVTSDYGSASTGSRLSAAFRWPCTSPGLPIGSVVMWLTGRGCYSAPFAGCSGEEAQAPTVAGSDSDKWVTKALQLLAMGLIDAVGELAWD